jgi:hypothetical protein
MIITNTMCRLSDLTKKQIDSLVDAMPMSDLFDFKSSEDAIGNSRNSRWGTFEINFNNPKIISYTEMMQLLGKTMKEFTKSDLLKLAQTETVVIKQRGGNFCLVTKIAFCGKVDFVKLSSFNLDLLNVKNNCELDVIEVYGACEYRSMTSYLSGLGLKLIWERTEQTPAQKEMEVLQGQIDKGAAYMAELHEQAKRLQAKL